ncbi:hypothetical protein HDV00_011717 [Rhizophlyctis rosea]|nr:hypothetical protein HDV00_011717 [Rhizophlyctis rosea]
MPVQRPWSLRKVNEVSNGHYQPIFRTVSPIPETTGSLPKRRAVTAGPILRHENSREEQRRALLYPAKLRRLERVETLEEETEEAMLHEFSGLNPSQRTILLRIINRPATAPAQLSRTASQLSTSSSSSVLSELGPLPIERPESFDSDMSFPVESYENLPLTEEDGQRADGATEGRRSVIQMASLAVMPEGIGRSRTLEPLGGEGARVILDLRDWVSSNLDTTTTLLPEDQPQTPTKPQPQHQPSTNTLSVRTTQLTDSSDSFTRSAISATSILSPISPSARQPLQDDMEDPLAVAKNGDFSVLLNPWAPMASESERAPRIRVTLEENPPEELLSSLKGRKESEVQWGSGGKMVFADGEGKIIKSKRRKASAAPRRGSNVDKRGQYGAWYINPREWSSIHHTNTQTTSHETSQTTKGKRRSQIQERIQQIMAERVRDDALIAATHGQLLGSSADEGKAPEFRMEDEDEKSIRTDADDGDSSDDEPVASNAVSSKKMPDRSRPQTPSGGANRSLAVPILEVGVTEEDEQSRSLGSRLTTTNVLRPSNRMGGSRIALAVPGMPPAMGMGRRTSLRPPDGGGNVLGARHGSVFLKRAGSRMSMVGENSDGGGATLVV